MEDPPRDRALLIRVLAMSTVVFPPALMLGLTDWSDLWTPHPIQPVFRWCLVPLVLAAAVHLAAERWLRVPASFVVRADRHEFRVPTRPAFAVAVLLVAFSFALVVVSVGTPSGGPLVVSAVPILLMMFVGVSMAGSPDLAGLSADGLWVRWLPWRTRCWTWEELAGLHTVVVPSRWWQRAPGTVEVRLAGEDRPLSLSGSGVQPGFLAAAMEFYRDHPEARASIGSRDGLDRLGAALTDWSAPATVPSQGNLDGTW